MKSFLKFTICAILVLLFILSFIAKYQTHGVYWGQQYGNREAFETSYSIGKNVLGSTPAYVFQNDFGRTVMVITLAPTNNEWYMNLYQKFGAVVTQVQTMPGNVTNHLDFFNIQNSSVPFSTLLRKAGMPKSESSTALNTYFDFVTFDGYTYRVGVGHDGLAWVQSVFDPNGTILSAAETERLTNRVLLFYLGLAAVLSVILVCLLVIPKKIEKRKQTA